MSVRVLQRRDESRARATARLAESAGLTVEEYYAAIGAAFLAWRAKFWYLPRWTFDVFGGPLAGRFVAGWKSHEKHLLDNSTPDAGE